MSLYRITKNEWMTSEKIYNIPAMNHEETENVNQFLISKENESIIKNLSTKKRPEPDGFTAEFYQTLKGRMNANHSQILPKKKIEEEE
jgi:hypothetical protein